MPQNSVADTFLDGFWTHLTALVAAGRTSDARATLRAAISRRDCLELSVALGGLLVERQRYFDAIQIWTDGLDAAVAAGRRDVLAAIYSNLAAVYRDLGDLALARRFQQLALRYQDDCGAEDLLHLANDALACDRWELAQSLLDAAEDACPEDRSLQATVLATRGVLALRLAAPRPARRCLLAAYRLHRGFHDDGSAGRDLLNAAEAFILMNRLGFARRCLILARRHFRAAGQRLWAAEARVRRRRVEQLTKLSRFDAARN